MAVRPDAVRSSSVQYRVQWHNGVNWRIGSALSRSRSFAQGILNPRRPLFDPSCCLHSLMSFSCAEKSEPCRFIALRSVECFDECVSHLFNHCTPYFPICGYRISFQRTPLHIETFRLLFRGNQTIFQGVGT